MLFRIIRLMLLSGALAGAGSAIADTSPAYSTEKLADGVYLFHAGTQRSLFLVGTDGVIVTDPLNAGAAQAYQAAVAAVTDRPVRYVVYSHYHWDRVSGGEVFKRAGATFVAQERCAERFRVNPNPAVIMPDVTFTDHYAVQVGDATLELHYFGPAHGDCLTVFLAEPANLMQVVELVNPPRATFPPDENVPYIKPHNLRQFFAGVEKLAAERGVQQVVASIAPPYADDPDRLSSVAPVALIGEQAAFWDAVYAGVEVAEAAGRVGNDSFVRMKPEDLEPFRKYAGFEPAALPVIMRRFVGFYDMGR